MNVDQQKKGLLPYLKCQKIRFHLLVLGLSFLSVKMGGYGLARSLAEVLTVRREEGFDITTKKRNHSTVRISV